MVKTHPIARPPLFHGRIRLGGLVQRALLDLGAHTGLHANRIVSSTSRDVPDGCPLTLRPGRMRSIGLIGNGSGVTPTMTSSPCGPSPPTV